MNIDGFEIAGYRSFGESPVRIDGLGKINIFIGKNNSGKSNVLRFIKEMSNLLNGKKLADFSALDFTLNSKNPTLQVSVQITKGSENYDRILQSFPRMEKVLASDVLWVKYTPDRNGHYKIDSGKLAEAIGNIFNEYETNDFARQYLQYSGATHQKRSIDMAALMLNLVQVSFEVILLPEFRRISIEGTALVDGTGIIKELRKYQNPVLASRDEHLARFTKIQDFLKGLLNEHDVKLEIPHTEDDLNIIVNNKALPLRHWGTGVHELVIMACATTIHENKIFCIEEPETHLHPELQKKFLNYLLHETNNQYFISTHSSSFFDFSDANIYHCKLKGGHTECELVKSSNGKFEILSELGYKASDLLQANCIIWVEGPSDRICINKWISEKDPNLKEGIHYVIMFYGGRLLSHLSYENEEVNNFISLGRINRNSAIVIDSDRKTEAAEINKTKERIVKEFTDLRLFSWVTAGREIENYFPSDSVIKSLKATHKNITNKHEWGKFDDIESFVTDGLNKITFTKEIVKHPSDFSVFDLNEKITQLIAFIKGAN